MKLSLSLLTLTSLLLASCSTSKPHVVTAQNGNESQLSCLQLTNELQIARHHKNNARAEDRFMAKHMNPFTVFFSIYNMNKAESQAQERITLLEQFYQQKRCDGQPSYRIQPSQPYYYRDSTSRDF